MTEEPCNNDEDTCIDIVEKETGTVFETSNHLFNNHMQVQQPTNEEYTLSRSNNCIMLTSEGQCIQKVLQKTPVELKRYDELKYNIKHKGEKVKKDNVLNLLTPLQVNVSRTVTELEKDIENWERSYIVNNNLCAPTNNDRAGDLSVSSKLNRIKIGKKLLKTQWKIQL